MSDYSLLQSLFDEEERRPLSVSELNAQVRGELEKKFASVWVEVEGRLYRPINPGEDTLEESRV